jgi:hypothetical protein
MAWKYNPFTDDFDYYDNASGSYLKIDQVVPETVVNGAPVFSEGLVIKAGKKIIFDGA